MRDEEIIILAAYATVFYPIIAVCAKAFYGLVIRNRKRKDMSENEQTGISQK